MTCWLPERKHRMLKLIVTLLMVKLVGQEKDTNPIELNLAAVVMKMFSTNTKTENLQECLFSKILVSSINE
jgi:hypothetical protein